MELRSEPGGRRACRDRSFPGRSRPPVAGHRPCTASPTS